MSDGRTGIAASGVSISTDMGSPIGRSTPNMSCTTTESSSLRRDDSPLVEGERTTFVKVRHPGRRRGFITAGIVIGIIVVVIGMAAGLSYLTYRHVKGPLQSVQNSLTALAHNSTELNSTVGPS